MAIRNRMLQLMAREAKSFDDKSEQTEQAWASTGSSAPTAAATPTTPAASSRNRFLTPWRTLGLSHPHSTYHADRLEIQLRYTSAKRTGQRATTKYQYIPQSSTPTCRHAQNRLSLKPKRAISNQMTAPRTWRPWHPIRV